MLSIIYAEEKHGMILIDTHTHIYQNEFECDIDIVIERAKNEGLEKILLPNIDSDTITKLHALADKYPNYCLPMMGLHPTSVKENWEEEIQRIKEQLNKRTYIAIGEIGLDFYWDTTFEKEQKRIFEIQLQWSIELDLPVVIHSRNAVKECVGILKEMKKNKLRGVFHSFGGTFDEAKEVLSIPNFMLGISGPVTFKNSSMPTWLAEIDLSHLLIETDAPYLTPHPFRGKRNEPSYTVHIANKLAEIYNTSAENIGELTSNNARKLFRL